MQCYGTFVDLPEGNRAPVHVLRSECITGQQGKNDHGLAVSVQGKNPSMYRAEVYGKRIHIRSIEQREVQCTRK